MTAIAGQQRPPVLATTRGSRCPPVGRTAALLAGLAVVLLHLVVLWLLTDRVRPTPPAGGWRQSTLRLLRPVPYVEAQRNRPAPASVAVPTSRSTRPQRLPRGSEAIAPPTPVPRTEPSPATAPTAGPGEPVESLSRATAASAPAFPSGYASEPERVLDLSLRPGSRSGAISPSASSNDRRIHGVRQTAEQRMTEALGNSPEHSEALLADGTRRLRADGRCYLVHPSRAATLFPFEQSAARAPKTVEVCE